MDENLNVSELRKMAEESINQINQPEHINVRPQPVSMAEEETPMPGNEWMTNIPNEVNTNNTPDVPVMETTQEAVYTGPGVVINQEDLESAKEPVREYTGITPTTQSHIDEYMANMDMEIEEAQKKQEAMEEEVAKESSEKEDEDLVSMFSDEADEEDDETEEPEMTKSEFRDKYNEAVVLIDKTGFGKPVIDFTDEEREKLRKAKSIKLEEVETIELDTIKTKRVKSKKDLSTIINSVSTSLTTKVTLPYSGYIAEMSGCSAYELVTLLNTSTGNTTPTDIQNRWSLIHSKVKSTTLGDMNFTEFMRNTASQDYDTLLFGIMCSTYPDEDKMEITCRKCGRKYEHAYLTNSLIRVEQMGDELKDVIMKIVDSSYTMESAKQCHEESPVCAVTRIKLPVSGIICDLGIRSMYDNLNNVVKELNVKENLKYEDALLQSAVIRAMYIPDTEANDGSYYELEDGIDIAKALYNLSKTDSDIVLKKSMEEIRDLGIKYGFMDIECPHCHDYVATEEIDLTSLLFYLNRQAEDITVR